ncbi:MAG TPA: cellulase N-terminal Ig-like domain-containing protein, partial [Clostridia bacterium]|nr:cellulase N-terminal Ig-like domain-containing protein [Clostridia bacterium]
MHVIQLLTAGLVCVTALGVSPLLHASSDHSLRIAQSGETGLRIITPTLLELTLTTGLKAGHATPPDWSYADDNGKTRLPDANVFSVRLGDKTIPVKRVGFKRRAAYAPLKAYDLRVENTLYLELAEPIPQGQPLEIVRAPDKSWRSNLQFRGILDPHRLNAALHVNQTGYLTGRPKRAMAGYFLGSLGELDLAGALRKDNEGLKFHLLECATSKPVFTGQLKSRPDEEFPSETYQRVMEADFSAFDQYGEFRLFVPGLGVSFPFRIDGTIAG